MSNEFRHLKWYAPFYMDKPISDKNELLKSQGVYLWVYENDKHKKIIYVGSAWSQNGFIKRIKEEISDILTGNAFIFKIEGNEDPYSLLTKTENELGNNFYYPSRGSVIKEFSWIRDYAYEYLGRLRYWVCPLPQPTSIKMRELCQILETQIQAVLKDRYQIKYIEDKKNLSWVGKLDKLFDETTIEYHFEFDNFPETDNKSIFTNLNDKAVEAIKNIKKK